MGRFSILTDKDTVRTIEKNMVSTIDQRLLFDIRDLLLKIEKLLQASTGIVAFTKKGTPVTQEMIDKWVAEAEVGYDVEEFKKREEDVKT